MSTIQPQNEEIYRGLRIRAEMFHCFMLQKYAYSGQTLGQIKKDLYDLAHISIGAFLQGDAVQVCLLHADLFSVSPNPIPDLATITPEQYRPLQFMDMLAEKDRNTLSMQLKGSSIGAFDFNAFAGKVGCSLGAVYYGALQVANEWSQGTFENPIESNAVKQFAESEEGVKWASWLVNDLRANGPLNLTAIGGLHFLPEGVKATRWIKYISESMDIGYDFAGGGNDVCWIKSMGRHGPARKTTAYTGQTPHANVISPAAKPKPMPTVANDPAIPVKDTIQLQKNQRFWGVVDISGDYKDPFGTPMMLIKMLQLEHTSELAGFHLRTKAVDYVSDGEFVVGATTHEGQPFITPPQSRPIMFREWREFVESRSYHTLEDFIRSGNRRLTPAFRTFSREIFILDAGRAYAGFSIDFKTRTTSLKSTILRSRLVLASVFDLGKNFFFLNGLRSKVTYLQDEFRLAFAHKESYNNTDALLSDQSFWEEIIIPDQPDHLDPVEQTLVNAIRESPRGKLSGPDLGSLLKKEFPELFPYKGFEKLRPLLLSIPCIEVDPLRDEYFIRATPPPQTPPTPQTSSTPPSTQSLSMPSSKPSETRKVTEGNDTVVTWEHLDECDFLANLLKVVGHRCHYSYASRDIIRFHTAIKNGMLTILGGDPGTGKSSLIEIYSRALFGNRYSTDPTATSTFLQVSVNPAWAEPADLLGFEGASGKFREARNGLCQFLRQAMDATKNDELRICCFEEINLACVEHYFSDFMQLLSRTSNRTIAGYDRAGFPPQPLAASQEQVKAQDQNRSVPLELGDNVRFVGTCNFDETVKPMSRRFYDRCHYIELESPRNLEFSEETPLISRECFADLFTSPVSFQRFQSWRSGGLPIEAPVARLFSLLTGKLAPLDLMPSYRCANDIKQYILMRPPNPDDEHELYLGTLQLHALDEAVAQKILSKFRPDPFKSKEQQELHAFLLDAKLDISAHFMEILNKRYEVPQF